MWYYNEHFQHIWFTKRKYDYILISCQYEHNDE